MNLESDSGLPLPFLCGPGLIANIIVYILVFQIFEIQCLHMCHCVWLGPGVDFIVTTFSQLSWPLPFIIWSQTLVWGSNRGLEYPQLWDTFLMTSGRGQWQAALKSVPWVGGHKNQNIQDILWFKFCTDLFAQLNPGLIIIYHLSLFMFCLCR